MSREDQEIFLRFVYKCVQTPCRRTRGREDEIEKFVKIQSLSKIHASPLSLFATALISRRTRLYTCIICKTFERSYVKSVVCGTLACETSTAMSRKDAAGANESFDAQPRGRFFRQPQTHQSLLSFSSSSPSPDALDAEDAGI